jgi:hypothetical protein
VAANEGAGFSGRAGSEMATLEDDDIAHTALGELKCGRQAIDAPADYYDTGAAWQIAWLFTVDDTICIPVAGHRDKSRSSIQPPAPSCDAAS